MRQNVITSLILLTFVILSTCLFTIYPVEANGDTNTPTFTLDLEPASPSTWPIWRPEHETNTSFVATIKGKTSTGVNITRFTNVRFTFDLGTPSQWKGVCMNFNGDTDVKDSYDLFFRKEDNPSGSGYAYTVTRPIVVPGEKQNTAGNDVEIGLGITETDGSNSSVTVSVRVNDYAAAGILSASATFNYEDPRSGSRSPSGSASNKISIPLDNNGNDIADGWRDDKNQNYNPWDDKETGPGVNTHTGDGFTVFEEYRGFIVQDEHESTQITEKDLFIYSEFTKEKIGHTKTALPSGMKAFRVKIDEFYKESPTWTPSSVSTPNHPNRAMNFNKCVDGFWGSDLLQVVEQKALWVADKIPIIYGFIGFTNTPSYISTPYETTSIDIDKFLVNQIDNGLVKKKIHHGFSWPANAPTAVSERISDRIKRAIAHEVGHGIGLYHPFDPIFWDDAPTRRWNAANNTWTRVRFHDRYYYNNASDPTEDCWHEGSITNLTYGVHSTKYCGATAADHMFWDSGTTIMDYGNEGAKVRYRRLYRLEHYEAAYLANLAKARTYTTPLHDAEFMHVLPTDVTAHLAKKLPDPLRKEKPSWLAKVSTNRDGNRQTTTSRTTTSGKKRTAPDTSGDGTSGGGDGTSGGGDGTSPGDPVIPTPRVPSAPNRFSVRDGMNSSALLTWYTPSNSGSSAITGYKYSINSTITDPGGGSWSSFKTLSFRKLSRGYHFSLLRDLTNGVTYGFKICAVSAAGDGAASSVVRVTPLAPRRRPDEPSSLSGRGEVRGAFLSWTAPSNPGNPALSGYKYRWTTVASPSATDWSTWTSTGNGTTTSVSVSGLRANTRYYFQVVAVNSVGDSPVSNRASATPLPPPEPPGPPRLLSARPGDGQVTLSWSIPTTFGTSPLSRYEFRVDTNNDDTWGNWGSTGSRVTSVIVTDLTNGTTYGFQVRAVNGVGESIASNTATATPVEPRVPPSAPRELSARAGNGFVSLSWKVPSNRGTPALSGYKYRYATGTSPSSSDWTDWASTGSKSTSYRVDGLTNDVQHHFRVVAYNVAGNSPISNIARATPRAPRIPPGPPRELSAESRNRGAYLSWKVPSSLGSASLLRYEYQYAVGSSSTWTAWRSTGGTGTSRFMGGLTNGTSYRFVVRAVSSAGESSASNSASVTPKQPPTPPRPPRSLSVSNSGTGRVTLSWTSPTSSGSSIILRYEYQYATGPSPSTSSWTTWTSTGSTNTTHAVSGLTTGTLHSFRVRAVNAAGASIVSNTATITPPAPVIVLPSAPRELQATAGDSQVTLNWKVPTTVGSGITGYDYRLDTNDDGTWRTWKSTGSTIAGVTITGLTNGTLYAFEIRGRNLEGIGTASTKVTARPGRVPSAPRELAASPGNARVTLRWRVPSDIGGGLTSYDYRLDTGNDGTWTRWSSLSGLSTSATITDLTNGQLYGFQVRARNAVGAGTASNTATATPTSVPQPSVPSAPRNLSATLGSNSVTLSWTAPTDDGGGIDYYQYRQDTNADGTWASWRSTGSNSTSKTITGVSVGKTYAYEVRAVNAAGYSAASNSVSVTIPVPPSVPDAPYNLQTEPGNSQITVSWTAPDDNGSPITDYEFRVDRDNDNSWSTWWSFNRTTTSATISSLYNDRVYGIQIRAVNAIGKGPASATVTETPTTPDGVPDAPTGLTATAGDAQVYLSWTAPASDNGSPITDYEIRWDTHNDGTWVRWRSSGDTNTSETITSLTNDTEYAFQVRAVNRIGSSVGSNKVTATPAELPEAPTNVIAAAGNALVLLVWGAPTDTGSSSILRYEYRYRKSGDTWSTWESTGMTRYKVLNNLENEVTYEFEVRAVNSAGAGPSASASGTTTAKRVPHQPTNLYADAGDEDVYLSWDAPREDVNAPVTGYEYRYRENNTGSWGQWTSTDSTDAFYLVTGLTNDTLYGFQVHAVNDKGNSARTSTVTATPKASPPRVPSRPDRPTATSTKAGTVVLSWTAPDDGGSPITDYSYAYGKYVDGWFRHNWTSYSTIGSTNTTYTITGLESGKVYRFRVRAINSIGSGYPSGVGQVRVK